MKIFLFVIPVAVLLFISCDLLDSNTRSSTHLLYPLEAGNEWTYEREFGTYNFRRYENPDSVIEGMDFFMQAHSTVRSNGTVDLAEFSHISGAVTELEQTYVEEWDSFTLKSWNYYSYKDDGLYMVGYKSAGGASVMPKVATDGIAADNGFLIIFDGRYFNSVRELSEYIEYHVMLHYNGTIDIIIEEDPLKVIPRYMKTGEQWIFRTEGNPWRIDKRILGREIVEVPAGEFVCYKVQWFIDVMDTGEWEDDITFYDYYSEEGLIKRAIYFTDQLWTDGSGPDPAGWFDAHDISVMTGVELE